MSVGNITNCSNVVVNYGTLTTNGQIVCSNYIYQSGNGGDQYVNSGLINTIQNTMTFQTNTDLNGVGTIGIIITNSNVRAKGKLNIDLDSTCDGFMTAKKFLTQSDSRIKKGFSNIDDTSAKAIIKQLNVVNYAFQDVDSCGVERKTGFIAQELEKIFPECVNQVTDFIPNILSFAQIKWDVNTKLPLLVFKEDEVPLLKPGDMIKIKVNSIPGKSGIVINEVMGNYGNTVMISGKDIPFDVTNVFVLGTQVQDFRVIDYQPIIALLVSVVQSLI
jgi:hypothetical protein